MSSPSPRPPVDVALLAGLFTVSGVVHLVRPRTFARLVPRWVPAHREVILWSGVAELVCAAGLVAPRTRRTSGVASAALLVAVYPGNVKMAADSLRTRSNRFKAIAFARLPLQVPMIRTALKAARA